MVKIHGSISINERAYQAGDEIAWYKIYPFFLLHVLMFGASGFFMAYASDGPPVLFLYLHGGFAILIYTVFYFTIFGKDEVRWMFINAALGLFGIYSQIDWILSLFGHKASEYPVYVHVVPFLYYVLYTFLLRQALLDALGAREDEARRVRVDQGYVAISTILYLVFYLSGRG